MSVILMCAEVGEWEMPGEKVTNVLLWEGV